jgi:hypothetical protein
LEVVFVDEIAESGKHFLTLSASSGKLVEISIALRVLLQGLAPQGMRDG